MTSFAVVERLTLQVHLARCVTVANAWRARRMTRRFTTTEQLNLRGAFRRRRPQPQIPATKKPACWQAGQIQILNELLRLFRLGLCRVEPRRDSTASLVMRSSGVTVLRAAHWWNPFGVPPYNGIPHAIAGTKKPACCQAGQIQTLNELLRLFRLGLFRLRLVRLTRRRILEETPEGCLSPSR